MAKIPIRRSPPTLGAARKELQYDTMRELGRYADFFAKMCREHPELIKEHVVGAFVTSRTEEVEAGGRRGMNWAELMEWYAEQAESIADRIAGPKV